MLEISAPKNHFALAHEAQRSLLLAGGIGITPILCMAERLAIAGADVRTALLHAFARSHGVPRPHPEVGFASRWNSISTTATPSRSSTSTALLTRPSRGMHLYVCGPKGFMDAVLANARARAGPSRSCTTSSSLPRW